MLISLNLLHTHPTEEDSTSRAYHLIASIDLLNSKFATRTLLGTLCNIKEIKLLKNLVSSFLGQIFEVLFEIIEIFSSNFKRWALFPKMILFFASKTESKPALCALTKVLLLINFGRLATLSNWTPSKVIHSLYCLVY
jgi:hypothetical protein